MSGLLLMILAGDEVFSVTASPPELNSGASSATFTTATVIAIPAGGSGTYTYAWTEVSDPDAQLTINAPASAGTTVDITAIDAGSTVNGTIRCTVTDTVTMETATVDVDISHRDLRLP